MIELFIDGRAVDLPSGCSIALSALLEEIASPGSIEEKVHPLSVPMTPRNRSALGFPEQTLSVRRFNREKHSGKIQCKGTALLEGDVELAGCESDPTGAGYYKLRLVVRPPGWVVDATEKKLSDAGIAYTGTLNAATIRESWTSDSPVKFLPVKRDRYPAYGKTQTALAALGYENYHPFVQVKALLESIVRSSGYRIESEFLNEPFFQSLYMSGRYAGNESSENVLRMDFMARKTSEDRTTTADSEGRVYASDGIASHSIGNPVNEADTNPSSPSYGKSFRVIDGRPAFVPEENVIAGFEFHLKIGFGLELGAGNQAKGVSKINWGEETLYETSHPSPLADKKDCGGDPGYYRLVCFDKVIKSRRVTLHTVYGDFTYSFSDPVYRIYSSDILNRVTCQEYQNGIYVPTDNWALYDDMEYYQMGELRKELDLTVRSLPLLRTKNEPVYFDTLVFEGASPGSSFTFSQGASIRPVFYSMPEAGSPITFASLFAHEKPQLKLIEGVAHLFGLHFYTDEQTKTIYAEPRTTFLDNSREIDWTDKIDPTQPVRWEESGSERHEKETLLYKAGDAATERKSVGTGASYGAWSAAVDNRFARRGEKKYPNPLFTATLDEKNSLESAPDASMIVAGDRDEREGTSDFPEKIVRYLGMKALPEGQRWGWPSHDGEYPLVMFHSAGEDGFTLCFDDPDGQRGLKKYHQPFYDSVNDGKRLILHLRLTPSDMETILYPNSAHRDFRGNFTFRIRGEKFRGRLLEAAGYDPARGGVTRCVFAVEL